MSTQPQSNASVRVDGLRGTIVRSSIIGVDGVQRRDIKATWFQGLSLYVDLRQPIDRPFDPAVDDAFGGRCTTDGEGVTHWERLFDLQPAGEYPDAGRLSWDGDVLVEHGVHEAYVEFWHPDPAVAEQPAAGLLLHDHSGAVGILVRVGDRFGYGRRAAERRSETEVSLGRIDGVRWIVEASCVPGREGTELSPISVEGGWRIGGHSWIVTSDEGDMDSLGRPGRGA